VIYSIKTLSQLPLILKGFRKEQGVTQAAMAERLGISQQSYAYFEAQPEKATLERLFTVLRMLNVEISLNQTVRAPAAKAQLVAKAGGMRTSESGKGAKSAATATNKRRQPIAAAKRIVAPTGKKESW